MNMKECKAFVAGLYLASTEGREAMTDADAAYNLREWRAEKWEDIPDGLTPELLADLWNNCIADERRARI